MRKVWGFWICLAISLVSISTFAAEKEKPWSFNLADLFQKLERDYKGSEWISASSDDEDIQRAVQSCYRRMSEEPGADRVVILPYVRGTTSEKELEEIVERRFESASAGVLILARSSNGLIASFVCRDVSGQLVVIGFCHI